MQTIFKNPEHQAQFERDGYVIAPFFNETEVADLLKRYSKLPKVSDDGFFSTLYVSDNDFKRLSHEVLQEAGKKAVDHFLNEYEPLIGNFITKKTGPQSLMPAHQDWTFVDENEYTSINVWCPLVDVNHQNGAIYILKGCHKIDFTIRGTQIPHAFQKVTGMNFETLKYLPMKAGEVLLYDHKMIHASPPNTISENRIAVGWATVPKAAQPLHFKQSLQPGKLEKYAVNRDFFLTYTFGTNDIPADTEFLGTIDFELRQFSEAEISKLYVHNPVPRSEGEGFFKRIGQSIKKLMVGNA